MVKDALILAGGENTRLPLVKGFLEINGNRIIDLNVGILSSIFDRVIISTNNPELYSYLGVLMVGDIIKDRGPMTGIFSALTIPEVSDVFVTACDMPFINPVLVKYVVERWSDKWDAAIPVFDKEPQPLFGIYSKKIAETIYENIKKGERSLKRFLQKIKVLYIGEEEVKRIDSDGKSFININTMEDFQREIGGKTCLV
ncbi:MAG: hypothetical protein A2Y97_11135 [Nitrospirae bacterium RBG_13_39_12]|nr:MAG: hypothetical protein A2Y97_11135 [Nitrospirae bacterium RBG_13_39_12]